MTVECPKCHHENPDETAFCGKCGTKFESDIGPTRTIETPTEELTRGSIFAGRYEIIEELGKGGMGKVYRVEDTKIKKEIALKLIKPEIASDKKTIERFKNELTTARDISHRNVCRMYDLGEEKGQHYITMEYISGGDLKRLIRRVGQLPIGKAISIAKQICDGLEEAHSLGIVHRDLKPNNIMIDDNGNARIMDFGIARTVKAKGITGAGVMIGTPEYMSPEQVEAKEVDQCSDIYSLGIIMYEMLTGRLPFEADTPFAIGIKHKSEAPKDPKELNAQITEDLSQIILKCLGKEKENRYKNAEDVRSELERIEQGLPTTDRVAPKSKTDTSKEITVTFGVKRWIVPVVTVFVPVVIGLLLWSPWSKKEKKETAPILSSRPSIAVVYFSNDSGNAELDQYRSNIAEWLTMDLSQSRYLDVMSDDELLSILRKNNLLELKEYATEDLKRIASEGGVSHVLSGSLSRLGETYRIKYSLQSTKPWKNIGQDYVSGEGEESIGNMVDELTRKIKGNLDLTL